MYDVSNIVRYVCFFLNWLGFLNITTETFNWPTFTSSQILLGSFPETVTWGLGTSKWIWPTDLASAQGLWCHVKGVACVGGMKPTIQRKPGGRFFFFRIPGSVIHLFSKGKQKNVFPIWHQNEILKLFVSSSCILWDVYIRNQFVASFFMVAKGQSLMGDSWFDDLGGWQFGTTSSIWWIFGAIRVCESELLRTRKLARKNGGMGAKLLVDFGSKTVFN